MRSIQKIDIGQLSFFDLDHAIEEIFKIPGNTVEFVRDFRYNKHRVFYKSYRTKKAEGVWQND